MWFFDGEEALLPSPHGSRQAACQTPCGSPQWRSLPGWARRFVAMKDRLSFR